jgi:predicted Kef-type K+ transport protein
MQINSVQTQLHFTDKVVFERNILAFIVIVLSTQRSSIPLSLYQVTVESHRECLRLTGNVRRKPMSL